MQIITLQRGGGKVLDARQVNPNVSGSYAEAINNHIGGFRIYKNITELGFDSFSEVPDLISICKKMDNRSIFITATSPETNTYNPGVLPVASGNQAFGLLEIIVCNNRYVISYTTYNNERYVCTLDSVRTDNPVTFPWKKLTFIE